MLWYQAFREYFSCPRGFGFQFRITLHHINSDNAIRFCLQCFFCSHQFSEDSKRWTSSHSRFLWHTYVFCVCKCREWNKRPHLSPCLYMILRVSLFVAEECSSFNNVWASSICDVVLALDLCMYICMQFYLCLQVDQLPYAVSRRRLCCQCTVYEKLGEHGCNS